LRCARRLAFIRKTFLRCFFFASFFFLYIVDSGTCAVGAAPCAADTDY
jgi:hypothetical protein